LTKDKALKLALDVLVYASSYCDTYDAIDAIKEAFAQPEPDDLTIAYMSGVYDGKKQERALWTLTKLGQEIEVQPEQKPVVGLQCANCQLTIESLNDKVMRLMEERNFCPRCGKRTTDIHTCTPPHDQS